MEGNSVNPSPTTTPPRTIHEIIKNYQYINNSICTSCINLYTIRWYQGVLFSFYFYDGRYYSHRNIIQQFFFVLVCELSAPSILFDSLSFLQSRPSSIHPLYPSRAPPPPATQPPTIANLPSARTLSTRNSLSVPVQLLVLPHRARLTVSWT